MSVSSKIRRRALGWARRFSTTIQPLRSIGYTAIAEAIAETVLRSGLDPVAIGVNAMWGGGKSTVLKLTAEKLREHSDVIVVEVDPWEFVDSGDPRAHSSPG